MSDRVYGSRMTDAVLSDLHALRASLAEAEQRGASPRPVGYTNPETVRYVRWAALEFDREDLTVADIADVAIRLRTEDVERADQSRA